MGNVHLPARKAAQAPSPRTRHDDDGFDSDLSTDMLLLLEENARLRALVTQLSSLVLKHVVDQK